MIVVAIALVFLAVAVVLLAVAVAALAQALGSGSEIVRGLTAVLNGRLLRLFIRQTADDVAAGVVDYGD